MSARSSLVASDLAEVVLADVLEAVRSAEASRSEEERQAREVALERQKALLASAGLRSKDPYVRAVSTRYLLRVGGAA